MGEGWKEKIKEEENIVIGSNVQNKAERVEFAVQCLVPRHASRKAGLKDK